MFVDEDNLKQLLSVLEMMIDRGNNDLKDHFWLVIIVMLIEGRWHPSLNILRRFVASDSWGKKTSVVSGRERLTLGAITIAPKQRTIDGLLDFNKKFSKMANVGFNDYFLNLGPTNPFLEEYWDSLNCGMYGVSRPIH